MSQSIKNPQTGVSVDVFGDGWDYWENASAITTETAAEATFICRISNTSYSECLEGLNYGFSIPSNSTIDGIEVSIERFAPNLDWYYTVDKIVKLFKNGTLVGENKADTITHWINTEGTTVTYGGESDLWQSMWLPSDINSANFGAGLVVTSWENIGNQYSASVNKITITITYTFLGEQFKAVNLNKVINLRQIKF